MAIHPVDQILNELQTRATVSYHTKCRFCKINLKRSLIRALLDHHRVQTSRTKPLFGVLQHIKVLWFIHKRNISAYDKIKQKLMPLQNNQFAEN